MSVTASITLKRLLEAEKKASQLFDEIEKRDFLQVGKNEEELSDEIYQLANELFGTTRHWHNRIVRVGVNTLLPYYENPPLQKIKEDDILFLDLGPIFEEWEADLGRTYAIGNDPLKNKLSQEVGELWKICRDWYVKKIQKGGSITGAELYVKATQLAEKYGWEFGGEIAGHIVGKFPHEKLEKENKTLYIHPENHLSMQSLDRNGNPRHWILEIHIVDREKQVGGFYEQLLV